MPEEVVACFKFNSCTTRESYDKENPIVFDLEFSPVSPKDGKEFTPFWKYTPAGNIKLTCINADAAKFFEFMKLYKVTFTKIEPSPTP